MARQTIFRQQAAGPVRRDLYKEGAMRWTVLALLLASALPSLAGEAPESESEIQKIMRSKLERKVSFEFEETPVHEAISFIISSTGLNVICEDLGAKPKTISLKVKEKSLSDSLNQILDQAGLEFQIGNTAMYIVKKGSPKREDVAPFKPVADWEKAFVAKLQKKITAEFVDTPLEEAVAFLRSLAKVNINLDAKLSRDSLVNWKFKDQTLETVLTKILRLQDMNYQFFHEGLLIRKNNMKRGTDLKPFEPHSETEKDVHKKLQRHVSFEFVDTPLPEAIQFLNSLTKSNFFVDPEINEYTPVSLRVEDITMENALLWIMLQTDTVYAFRDDALFIASRETLETQPPMPLTKEEREEFVKAVTNLGSEDFNAREQATLAIRKLGAAALLPLVKVKNAAKDAESAARLGALIEAFPRRMSFDESEDVAKILNEPKFLKKVTFDFVDTPLAECCRFLNVAGNLEIDWDRKADDSVTLRVVDMETRNALRWIARLAAGRMTVENGALKIISGPKKK
jgi:hypothetical protein